MALVDDEDFERVNQFKWYYNDGRASRTVQLGYKDQAKPKNSANQKKGHIHMHRFILNAPSNLEVDHKDHNQLNNQKNNIRLCNSSQNKANRRKRADATFTGYKGVEYIFSYYNGKRKTREKPWLARAQLNGKKYYLGYFTTAEEAARAYDAKARELFGEFAKTNF